MPGLPQAAAREAIDPLTYMRRYGAFDVPYAGQRRYAAETVTERGRAPAGFNTPSGRLEIYSPTVDEWGWGEQAVPAYLRSQIHCPSECHRTYGR